MYYQKSNSLIKFSKIVLISIKKTKKTRRLQKNNSQIYFMIKNWLKE